jgi:hypothetical protein
MSKCLHLFIFWIIPKFQKLQSREKINIKIMQQCKNWPTQQKAAAIKSCLPHIENFFIVVVLIKIGTTTKKHKCN